MNEVNESLVVGDTANVRVFKQITTDETEEQSARRLLAILQMYEFSSKSQPNLRGFGSKIRCWRYCKCTSFQANHNNEYNGIGKLLVVGDTANVRVFKQITTREAVFRAAIQLLAILQMYEFSSKSQQYVYIQNAFRVVGDTANVRVFKQITTYTSHVLSLQGLLAILQMYEFSSKSQLILMYVNLTSGCWRYCKCTSFQANHNYRLQLLWQRWLLAILQMYEFSSKSQLDAILITSSPCCWRYCKCTSFQANHNDVTEPHRIEPVVGDTANVRVFKQITTHIVNSVVNFLLLAILQMYEFSSKSQR